MGPGHIPGLADRIVRESIMTGIHWHFLGCHCKCCGTYDRHSQVAQVAFAYRYFKCEMKLSGSTGSFDTTLSLWPFLRKAT